MSLTDPESQFQGHIEANISRTVHPIHSIFGSGLGFSGSTDRLALFRFRSNSNNGGLGKHGMF